MSGFKVTVCRTSTVGLEYNLLMACLLKLRRMRKAARKSK